MEYYTYIYLLQNVHPRKLTWNPKNGGLEDDFPFQLSVFLGGDFKYVYFHPETWGR